MRDSQRVMGVLALLAAMPAWASDMCELGAFVFLPPVVLWSLVAALIGGLVRRPGTVIASTGLLILGGLPALGSTLLSLSGAFHGSELRHDTMFIASTFTLAVLLASSFWAFWRLATYSRRTENASS